MAVSSTIARTRDLNKPTTIETLSHTLAMADDLGDEFNISVTRGSKPVSLTTGGVTGWFIRLEEGKKLEDCKTVSIIGSISSNVATIVLPESCYVTPGRFVLTITATVSGRRHAIYIAEGLVARTRTTAIVDPGHNIPDLDELLAMLATLETATKNANTAASSANTAASSANTAATNANKAKDAANAAADSANTAASAATAATNNAKTATTNANKATTNANSAAENAEAAASNAKLATTTALAAAQDADNATKKADTATSKANTAASNADKATSAANTAASNAEAKAAAAAKWENVSVSVTMRASDFSPICTVTDKTNGKQMSFELPRGLTGLTPNITVGKVTTGLPGTNVIITLRGTAENPILDFTIPRGDTGSIDSLPLGNTNPKPLGKASPGTSDKVSREDHVHDSQTAEQVGAVDKAGDTMSGNLYVKKNSAPRVGIEHLEQDVGMDMRATDAGIMGLYDTVRSTWILRKALEGDVSLFGNADTATKLATSRTIQLTGDVTGSASFNGSANATISTTFAKKLTVKDVEGAGFVRALDASDDLDKIIDAGIYYYNTASLPKNYPFSNAAIIEVITVDSTTNRIIQRATRWGAAGHSSFRGLLSGTWQSWTEVATTNELSKYLPLAGGTLTGPLYAPTPLRIYAGDLDNGNWTEVVGGAAGSTCGLKDSNNEWIIGASFTQTMIANVTWEKADIFSITSNMPIAGLITSSSKSIYLGLHLGSPINASSASVTELSGTLRGPSGYLDDTSSQRDLTSSPFTTSATIVNKKAGILRLTVTKTEAFTNVLNNTPVSFYLNALMIKFN